MARRKCAIGKYKRVLEVDPESLESILPLTQIEETEAEDADSSILLSREDWEKLIQIIKGQVDRLDQPKNKLLAYQNLAEIYEFQLEDIQQAFRNWCYAFIAVPQSELAQFEMERLARIVDDWDAVVGVYSLVLKHLDPVERKPILLKSARTYFEELRDYVQAEKIYKLLLQKNPEDNEVLKALDQIYSQSNRFKELVDILEKRIAIADDVEDRLALLLRLGNIYEIAQEDLDRACKAYQAVLEDDKQNTLALDALEKIYIKQQRWSDLFTIYETMLKSPRSKEARIDIFAKMAKTSSEALGDTKKAQTYLRRILDLDPQNAEANQELLRVYEIAEDWKALSTHLEKNLQSVEENAEKIKFHQRLATLYTEKLAKDRQAVEHWKKLLQIDPVNSSALYALVELYGKLQAWEEQIEILYRLLDIAESSESDVAVLKPLYEKIGELEGKVLLRPQKAIEAWLKVHQLDPEDLEALEALEHYLTQEAWWEDCIQVLERKIHLLPSSVEKAEATLQIARIYLERLEDTVAATESFEKVLTFDPVNASAIEALQRIFTDEEEWTKLIDLHFSQVEHTQSPSETTEHLLEIAEIYEKQCNKPEQAFLVLQSALKHDGCSDIAVEKIEQLAGDLEKWPELLETYSEVVNTTHNPELRFTLLMKLGRGYHDNPEYLEHAIAAFNQALSIKPDSIEILDELAKCYQEASHWEEWVATMTRRSEAAPDVQEKAEVLNAIAEALEFHLGQSERAIATYQHALEIDPENSTTLSALEWIFRRHQTWDKLIALLEHQANRSDDAEKIVALKDQIGQIYDELLEQPEQAITCYQSLLSDDDNNIVALKALERLYEKTRQTKEYLDVVERQLDLSENDDERLLMYPRIATAWEEDFDLSDRAAGCFEKVLEIDGRNEVAYFNLERIYRETNRHADLVNVLERHIVAIGNINEQVDLYLTLGQVYAQHLKNSEKAIEAYKDALTIDPMQPQALDYLAHAYEELDHWQEAVEVLDRLAHLSQDLDKKVSTLHHLGQIHEQNLLEVGAAEEYYQEALALDNSHVESMLRLIEIYKARNDWAKATSMMIRAEAFTNNELKKARLLYEAGRAFLDHLNDEQKAAELFAQTLEIDPDHIEAGFPLAELYYRYKMFERLEPILDMLARKAAQRDKKVMHDVYFKLAETSLALGKEEKALKYYKAAQAIEPTHLPTLEGMAAIMYEQKEWAGSFKAYQTILIQHRDHLDKNQIVETFYRLATIKLNQGERRKALNYFEKALEEIPTHKPTLEAMIELQRNAGDWNAVVEAQKVLIAISDVDDQIRILEHCAEIYSEKLHKPQEAMDAYRAVLRIKPDHHIVMHQLLELCTANKHWREAIEVIISLAEIEKKPEVRAKYFYTAGVICRDEMKENEQALQFFNQALDEAPSELKAFESIDRLCTAEKDWNSLERNYRKMIKRLPQEGQNELKVMLWHNLGEIYRTRLKNYKDAIPAFEVATTLDPKNLERHEILAELYYLVGPDWRAKAIEKHQELLTQSPYRIDSYHTLFRLYHETGDRDAAFCFSAALTFLQNANEEEKAFYLKHKRNRLSHARSRFSEMTWNRDVLHPDQDRHVGVILATIASVLGRLTARPAKDYGFKRKSLVDPSRDSRLFCQVFNYATSVLSVTQAELYEHLDSQADFSLANTTEGPAYAVGGIINQNRSDIELAYIIGQQLTYLRPEHFLGRVFPNAPQLRTIFLAALKLANPGFAISPQDMMEVDKVLASLAEPGRIQQPVLDQLAITVRHFVESKAAVNLQQWLNALSLSANRVGLILCNDLFTACQLAGSEPVGIGSVQPKDKAKDLLLYSVSPNYFLVRKELGITVVSDS